MATNIETWVEREASTREELNELRRNVEKTSKNPEITKREWRLAYCKVHPWDTIPKIRARLWKYPEFSYLKDNVYAKYKDGKEINERSEIWFNINPKHLRAWMDLMIPLKLETRQIEDKAFFENCKKAINNTKSNSTYWKRVSELVKKIWESNLARVMSAFAKVETANGKSDVKIWTWWLYRYENTSTYSVSYYHVIPKSAWAWDIALKNLNMKPWDTCDPVKAWMFFLWYWCECESYAKNKFWYSLEACLDPRKPRRFNKAAKVYNSWSSSYPGLLKTSYEVFRKIW